MERDDDPEHVKLVEKHFNYSLIGTNLEWLVLVASCHCHDCQVPWRR